MVQKRRRGLIARSLLCEVGAAFDFRVFLTLFEGPGYQAAMQRQGCFELGGLDKFVFAFNEQTVATVDDDNVVL